MLDVAFARLEASLQDVVLVRRLPFLDIPEDRIAHEGDAPVAQADQMIEETVTLEATDLLYRPIWAFEFDWQGKGKTGVVEVDSITGGTKQGKALVAQADQMIERGLDAASIVDVHRKEAVVP